jgi:hypothetical protein
MCAFNDFVTGVVDMNTAFAEVVGLPSSEVGAFLATSTLCMGGTRTFSWFTACVNALVSHKTGLDAQTRKNSVMLRSAIKWHVHLQRVRAKKFITASATPDDVMSFPGAVADGHADVSPVRGSRRSVAYANMGDSSPNGSFKNRPSALVRQRTQSAVFASRLSQDGAAYAASVGALVPSACPAFTHPRLARSARSACHAAASSHASASCPP